MTIDVLRNDGDSVGRDDPTLVGNPGCAGGGRAVVTADSQVRLRPAGGSGRRVPLHLRGHELPRPACRSASIIISVREPLLTNEPPVAVDDTLTVEVGAIGSKDVTINDSRSRRSEQPR